MKKKRLAVTNFQYNAKVLKHAMDKYRNVDHSLIYTITQRVM